MPPHARAGGVMPRASGRLSARTERVHALAPATRDALWALYARYYADVDRAVFERDLDGKTHVILLADSGDGALRGFSTVTRERVRHDGRRVLVVFSGDTVIHPAYWGQAALQNAFGAFITRTALAHPFTPVYWFLVSKGYKTFLLLARNFPEHWPRPGARTPAWERGLLDHVARARFGARWDAGAGLVRAAAATGRVADGVAPVPPHLADDAHVRLFLARNPQHARGDELACLGRVRLTTWPRYAARVLARHARRRGRKAREDAPAPTP